MKNRKVWIRVAGNAKNIKASHPQGWRCYIGKSAKEIALKDWSVSGVVSKKNFIPGVNATGDKRGLVAWIDCFGFYKVEDEVLHIELQ